MFLRALPTELPPYSSREGRIRTDDHGVVITIINHKRPKFGGTGVDSNSHHSA